MEAGPERPCAVLHALRLTGMAGPGRLAATTGLGEDRVRRRLEALAAAGLVRRHEGPFGGWAPTPSGTRHDDQALAAELRATDGRSGVEAAYRSFLALNGELLVACTDWQLVAGEVPPRRNDHGDQTYDAAVVRRLELLDGQIQPVLDALVRQSPRFAGYRPRLRAALERVRAGQHEWFTGALFDSYHQVWFELHQDLLVTLGIDRGEE